MNKIKLLVEIDEEEYENVKNGHLPIRVFNACVYAVENGTPLPKGHGRLIEANEDFYQSIRYYCSPDNAYEILMKAKTIIEADKENDNEANNRD